MPGAFVIGEGRLSPSSTYSSKVLGYLPVVPGLPPFAHRGRDWNRLLACRVLDLRDTQRGSIGRDALQAQWSRNAPNGGSLQVRYSTLINGGGEG